MHLHKKRRKVKRSIEKRGEKMNKSTQKGKENKIEWKRMRGKHRRKREQN